MNFLSVKLKAFLFNNSIAFVATLVILNFIVIKIPFEKLFLNVLTVENSKNISRILHGIIITTCSIICIRKLCLGKIAGIKLLRINRPLLLLIPIVYPMGLGIPNLFDLTNWETKVATIILTFLAMIAKGIAEEVAFRGLLQGYLIYRFSNNLSIMQIIFISATIFALMHIINITRYEYVDIINQVIAAFFFGVFFGAMILKVNNVFALGILHGCINFVFAANSIGESVGPDNTTSLYTTKEILLVIAKYALVFSPLLFFGIILLMTIKKRK